MNYTILISLFLTLPSCLFSASSAPSSVGSPTPSSRRSSVSTDNARVRMIQVGCDSEGDAIYFRLQPSENYFCVKGSDESVLLTGEQNVHLKDILDAEPASFFSGVKPLKKFFGESEVSAYESTGSSKSGGFYMLFVEDKEFLVSYTAEFATVKEHYIKPTFTGKLFIISDKEAFLIADISALEKATSLEDFVVPYLVSLLNFDHPISSHIADVYEKIEDAYKWQSAQGVAVHRELVRDICARLKSSDDAMLKGYAEKIEGLLLPEKASFIENLRKAVSKKFSPPSSPTPAGGQASSAPTSPYTLGYAEYYPMHHL